MRSQLEEGLKKNVQDMSDEDRKQLVVDIERLISSSDIFSNALYGPDCNLLDGDLDIHIDELEKALLNVAIAAGSALEVLKRHQRKN